jgi:hypothetical protein
MINRFPPLYEEFATQNVRFEFFQSASSADHWKKYSGQLLVPNASDVMKKLLSCLFIVGEQRRPAIGKVLQVIEGLAKFDVAALTELNDSLFRLI